MMGSFLRPLGSTGMEISALGLGTVKIGRDQGVKYPHAFRIPDDNAVRDLLALARDLGINLIDTAPAYGNSEERLGKLLPTRRDWVIVSKVGEEFSHGESHFDFSARHTRYSVERSLQRLNTDYLDVVLVHSDGRDLDILAEGEVMDTLATLKREGLIRCFGFSGKTAAGGLQALKQSDVAMVTSNLVYDEEQSVIDYAAAHDKGILIKKAFASGHVCADGGDAVQQTFDKLLNLSGVSSIIAGTINAQHLRDNVAKARRALGL